MAKRTTATSLRGEFSLDTMEITEVTKESVNTYDLLSELRYYDGKNISIVIKEEKPIVPKEQG